jgi:hypothetical protein
MPGEGLVWHFIQLILDLQDKVYVSSFPRETHRRTLKTTFSKKKVPFLRATPGSSRLGLSFTPIG